MPRVILYRGAFAYDAVNVFVEELAAGLAALGRETLLIDLTVEDDRRRIEDELERPFECIVAFGAVGNRPRAAPPGTHMYDRLAAPYVAVLVDHPAHHLDRFHIDNMILACHDRTHAAFLAKYFGGAKRVAFLPHGGSAAAAPAGVERPIDILFPGTYADPDAAYAALRAGLPDADFEIMDFVVERLLLAERTPMEEALANVLAAEGREDEWPRFCRHLPLLESFVKPYKRLEALRRLDRAGLAVEIVGHGWPAGLFQHHRLRPACPYGDILGLMARAKMVLNMGFVPDGSHERVCSALLNGAMPVSDRNPWLSEILSGDGDAVLFGWTELERLPERLAAVRADARSLAAYPERAARLGKAHTWAARAAPLLELVRQGSTRQARLTRGSSEQGGQAPL